MNNKIIEVKISDIKIGNRHRKDIGDIEGLAQSIEETGLLQPIGITEHNELVFGERRLRAYRDFMRRETIPARIVDVQSVLHGEFTENLMRKDFTVSERVAIVEALRSYKHGGDRRSKQVRNSDVEALTVDQLAKRVGLGGKDRYADAKKVIDSGVPELREAMDKGEMAVSAAAKLAEAPPDEQAECMERKFDSGKLTARAITKQRKRIENRKKREEALTRAVQTVGKDDSIQIHHCPFQNLEQVAGIEPESVQLICTDIPYGKDFLDQIEDLAAFAKRVLTDGGVFVTYSGQYWLRQVMEALDKHLTYRWAMASVWDGDACVVNPLNLTSQWKPVLVYSKGDWKIRGRWPDLLRVRGKEKNWHKWQQPLEEVEKLVRYFSKPGDLVVDPCGGGFTTAIACLRNHRRFIGCDVDKAAVVSGQQRLDEERIEPATVPLIAEQCSHVKILCGDCVSLMSTEIEDESVDVVVTSVPYNIGVKYGTYKDNLPEFDYLEWLAGVFTEIRGVLKDEGSIFLNVGSNRRKPWTAMRVAEVAGQFFKLQNEIIWVKSIAVGGRSHGNFNPVNSQRYLHHNWEHVFHFSKSGKVCVGQAGHRRALSGQGEPDSLRCH